MCRSIASQRSISATAERTALPLVLSAVQTQRPTATVMARLLGAQNSARVDVVSIMNSRTCKGTSGAKSTRARRNVSAYTVAGITAAASRPVVVFLQRRFRGIASTARNEARARSVIRRTATKAVTVLTAQRNRSRRSKCDFEACKFAA
eukprot:3484039-Rhodomonas_salina.2